MKRKSDWVGRKVRLRRQVETRGGTIFPAGEVMVVDRNYGGLHLTAVQACPNCSLMFRHQVKGVSEHDVDLLEE
jgi:hypothetical protein